MYLNFWRMLLSSITYFAESGSPVHRHILVVSSYLHLRPQGPLCRGYLCLESDYSISIDSRIMVFTQCLCSMHGYILLTLHLICMRIDEVTGTWTYNSDNIFGHLSTGDTYREEFRLFILPWTEINYQFTFQKHSDMFPCYLQASETALDQTLL